MTSLFVDSRWVGEARKAAAWLVSGWVPSRPLSEERRAPLQRPSIERIRGLLGWRRSQTLVGRRYTQRGLRVSPAASPEPGLVTLQAHDGRRLVGTLSVRMDGVDGLAADATFPEELLRLRAKGKKLCEFCRLAVEGEQAAPKPVLAGLFHLAYLVGHRIHGADLLVIEVNPRHAPFYRRMLGAKKLDLGTNQSVDAPSVLMCLDLLFAQEQIRRFGGRPELAEEVRSFYPFFYAPSEEPMLVERLKADLADE